MKRKFPRRRARTSQLMLKPLKNIKKKRRGKDISYNKCYCLLLVSIHPKEEGIGVLPSCFKLNNCGFHGVTQKLEICSLCLKGIIRRCLIHARERDTFDFYSSPPLLSMMQPMFSVNQTDVGSPCRRPVLNPLKRGG